MSVFPPASWGSERASDSQARVLARGGQGAGVRCSRGGPDFRRCLSPLPGSQGLRREIQAHGPRLEEVLERAGALASLRSPEAEAVRHGQEQLQSAWAGLREAAERRQQVLDAAFQVEQYYFDVAEVEAWLGEQELLMMSEDKGKVRPGWGGRGAWGLWRPEPAAATSSRAPCALRTNRAPCSCSRSTCSWSRAWRTTRKASRSCRASAGRCWRWGTRTGGRAAVGLGPGAGRARS